MKTIVNSTDQPSRITALCWSTNNQKLAVCGSDKIVSSLNTSLNNLQKYFYVFTLSFQVSLFDDNGVRQDKFPTKAADAKVFYF